MSAEKPDGLWCRGCKKRHGYMVMGVNYIREFGKWKMFWLCPISKDVLQEVKLNETVQQNEAGPDGTPAEQKGEPG
jgi:hypothetical protein